MLSHVVPAKFHRDSGRLQYGCHSLASNDGNCRGHRGHREGHSDTAAETSESTRAYLDHK